MAQDDFDEFFQGGGGDFAPTLKFTKDKGPEGRTQVGGGVIGEILSMNKQNQKKFGTNDDILDRDGEPKKELKIVLQTALRDWDKVAKVPLDDDKNPLAESEDDGRRAIYVRGWMTGAIGDAVKKATGKPGAPKVGGRLGVKLSELVPTDNGNPYPKYEAVYEAPSGAEGFDFDKGGDEAESSISGAQKSAPEPTPDDEPPF
jgi:hypothetical protein